MTFPSLRNLLREGYQTQAQSSTAVLDEPTLIGAVQSVIAHTHQRTALVVPTHNSGRADAVARHVVYDLTDFERLDSRRSHYPDGHTRFASLYLSEADIDDWARATGGPRNQKPNCIGVPTFTTPRRPSKAVIRRRRAALLTEALSHAIIAVPTVEEVVTATFPDQNLSAFYGAAGIALWLQARIEQGYDLNTAHTMLALTAAPATLAYMATPAITALTA